MTRVAWRIKYHGAQSSNVLRYSRKRDVHSVSFLRCDAYMGLVEKHQQETFQ